MWFLNTSYGKSARDVVHSVVEVYIGIHLGKNQQSDKNNNYI